MSLAPKTKAPAWRLRGLELAIPGAGQRHPLLSPLRTHRCSRRSPSVSLRAPAPQCLLPLYRRIPWPQTRNSTLGEAPSCQCGSAGPYLCQHLHRPFLGGSRASLTTDISVLLECSLLSPSHPTQFYPTHASLPKPGGPHPGFQTNKIKEGELARRRELITGIRKEACPGVR